MDPVKMCEGRSTLIHVHATTSLTYTVALLSLCQTKESTQSLTKMCITVTTVGQTEC